MSDRAPPGEVHFGNDSFLDVLANMVGILIILVVIAGAQAAKLKFESANAAKKAEEAKAAETKLATAPAITPHPVPVPVEKEPPTVDSDTSVPEVASVDPPAVNDVRPDPDSDPGVRSRDAERRREDRAEAASDLVSRLEELRRETKILAQKSESEKQALAALEAREKKSQVQLAGIHEEAAAARNELESARDRLDELQKLLQRDWTQFSGLLAETETARHAKGPIKQVQHRLTPVSRAVSGEELHFRIENGMVAYVPLEELVDRVKSQMMRQKEIMLKFRRHQGSVGPIDGFSMEYLVVQQGLSVVDEARNGSARGMIRIGLAGWQIVAEKELEGESVEVALRPDSKFARRLQQANAEAALTFWVYPESFPAFRKLQAAAHSAGFTVSGRPLPTGVPITGSPTGSRSAGQ